MKILKRIILPAAALLMTLSCSHQKGWIVEGMAVGAEQDKIALEGFNNGRWYVIDSLEVNKKGSFCYQADAPAAYPDILRLTFDGRSIYFPVDSIDRISVTTTADGFGSEYTLNGTPLAESIRDIDAIIARRVAEIGESAIASDSLLKRRLSEIVVADTSAIAAYYIINKSVGGHPLYNLSDRADLRVFGAVAQRFAMSRPDDPRTAYLSNVFLSARARNNPAAQTSTAVIELPEKGLIDIVRYDNKGIRHALSDVADKGGVTLLSFTDYGMDVSPAYNVILNGIYEKYKDRGLQIYQLAFDKDEVSWKQTAVNLPWITVWNAITDGSQVILEYNVGILPLTYIIDRTGSITERISDPAALEAAVAKLF